MPSVPFALVLAATLLAAAGCSDPTAPGEVPAVGIVWFYDQPVRIEAPDTVAAGEAFSLHIRTYGDGCRRRGGTDVRASGDSLLVTPIDTLDAGAAGVCPDILLSFDHRPRLSWPTTGTVTLVVRGWEEPAGRERAVRLPIVVR